MASLSWLQIFIAVYLSLLVFKLYLVYPDFKFIAVARIHFGTLVVQKGWSVKGYTRFVAHLYFVGASAALLVLLIPTLFKEGFSFFKSYPKKDLLYYAEQDKWVN